MKIEQVAVQLYTLRDSLTTPESYEEALHKVSEIGYRSVQVSGPRPVEEKQIAAWCEEKGLVINSSHENPNQILERPHEVVMNLEAFGCKYTAYPAPNGVDLASEDEVSAWIGKLDAAGQIISEAGKVLTYHNHAFEFEKLNGDLLLDRIYRETSPEHLQAELDTYWVYAGGGDPAAWAARMRNRLPLIHLKDYREAADGTATFAEVGHGQLDFRAIVAEAERSGCFWFIVEQDTCPGDPFESLEASFRYIYDHLTD